MEVAAAKLAELGMSLCLVTETFPPEINGVAMTLGRMVEGLVQRGVQVSVVAPARADRNQLRSSTGERLVVRQLPVKGLPIPRYPELRFGLPAGGKLRRFWQCNRPDIVHVATEGPLGWSALRLCRRMGIRCVSSFHTNFHNYGAHYGYGFLRKLVLDWLRYCHNRTAITFAPSEDLIQQLESAGFRNLRLLSRGVDTRLFSPQRRCEKLRTEWGADQQTPVAIYVGRLAGEKNLDLVVRAYERMRAELPRLRMVFVGDGPDRSRIEKQLPDAHFAGMRTGADLAAHYASADCFLFGSTTETFGNVVTEALASGLAVLAFNYAAPGRFIRHGQNGWLAAFADEADFLDKAVQLARCHGDWPALGAAARATMAPFSWDGIVDGYLADIGRIYPPARQLQLHPQPAIVSV